MLLSACDRKVITEHLRSRRVTLTAETAMAALSRQPSLVNQHLIKGHADIWKLEAGLLCGLAPSPCLPLAFSLSLNHLLTFCQTTSLFLF